MSDADVDNVKLGDRVTANVGTNVDAFISGRVVDRADVDGGTFLVVETDPVGVVYVPPDKVVDVQDGADDPETVEDAVQILRSVRDGGPVSSQRFDWAMERVIAFVEQNTHADARSEADGLPWSAMPDLLYRASGLIESVAQVIEARLSDRHKAGENDQ